MDCVQPRFPPTHLGTNPPMFPSANIWMNCAKLLPSFHFTLTPSPCTQWLDFCLVLYSLLSFSTVLSSFPVQVLWAVSGSANILVLRMQVWPSPGVILCRVSTKVRPAGNKHVATHVFKNGYEWEVCAHCDMREIIFKVCLQVWTTGHTVCFDLRNMHLCVSVLLLQDTFNWCTADHLHVTTCHGFDKAKTQQL